MSDPFIGEIRMFTFTYAPRNWAYCDGQTIPISQNPSLFSILGVTYGGDGYTNFGVPNLQGRVPMQPRQGPGLSYYRLGQSGGLPTTTLNETQMPNHTHDFQVTTNNPTSIEPAGLYPSKYKDAEDKKEYAYKENPNLNAQFNPSAVGSIGGQEHENRQPFLTVPFCICLSGVYPSRN